MSGLPRGLALLIDQDYGPVSGQVLTPSGGRRLGEAQHPSHNVLGTRGFPRLQSKFTQADAQGCVDRADESDYIKRTVFRTEVSDGGHKRYQRKKESL